MTRGRTWDPSKPLDPSAVAQVKKTLLERRPYYAAHAIDHRVFAANGLDIQLLGGIAEDAYLRLSAYVWSETLQDERVELTTETPATWWQHLKQSVYGSRACPRWMVRRWPVKMVVHTKSHVFKTIALLPEFKYEAPPQCGTSLVISSLESF